jgi:hypothetical protein
LENLVVGYKFNYSCEDDPAKLILIMCEEAPQTRECQIAENYLGRVWSQTVNQNTWNQTVYGNESNQTVYRRSVANHHSISFLRLLFLLIPIISFRVNEILI